MKDLLVIGAVVFWLAFVWLWFKACAWLMNKLFPYDATLGNDSSASPDGSGGDASDPL